MLAPHQILRRDVDPIDDVRYCLEQFYTGYYNRMGGDWMSDDYWRIIELTTQPGKLNRGETYKLNRSIGRLSENYPHIQRRLGSFGLDGVYDSVAAQINAINSSEPSRGNIGPMVATPLE